MSFFMVDTVKVAAVCIIPVSVASVFASEAPSPDVDTYTVNGGATVDYVALQPPAPETTAPRNCEVTKEFRTLMQTLSTKQREQAESLANQIDKFRSARMAGALTCGITDGGALLAEWILEDRRLGFSIEPEATDSGWYYVDKRPGRHTQQGGQLPSLNLAAVLQLALSDSSSAAA